MTFSNKLRSIRGSLAVSSSYSDLVQTIPVRLNPSFFGLLTISGCGCSSSPLAGRDNVYQMSQLISLVCSPLSFSPWKGEQTENSLCLLPGYLYDPSLGWGSRSEAESLIFTDQMIKTGSCHTP